MEVQNKLSIKNNLLSNSLTNLGFGKFCLGDERLLIDLSDLYLNFYGNADEQKGMFVTHNKKQNDKALIVHENIKKLVSPYLNKHFKNYTVFASHFVVKAANGDESFQLHQDWNLVDEKQNNSFQIWIPLDISYPENGGLGFVPLSHRFFNNIRSGSFGIPRIPVTKSLYKYLSYLRLMPGEAAIFHNSTFHCSFTNSTPDKRIAVLVNIVDENISTTYHHYNPYSHHLELYKIDSQVFLDNLHELEKGNCKFPFQPIKSIPYNQENNSDIDENKLIEKITKYNSPPDYEHKIYQILKNKAIEKQVNHSGYTIIPLLNNTELEVLKEGFIKYFPNRKQFNGRYSSMDNLDGKKRMEIHHFIQSCIKNNLDQYFQHYKSPISILYSKRADGVDDIDWHSDPSLIFNEHIEPMYGIWSPLIDVNDNNGALKVVPGSHRLFNKLHGSDKVIKWPLANRRRILDKFGVTVELKAGEAILYDSRIVHSSFPNMSDKERDCIMMRINHEQSEYFNIGIKTADKSRGIVYKQSGNYFFGNAVSKHTEIPNTGIPQGYVYLFDEELSNEEIDTYLKAFQTTVNVA